MKREIVKANRRIEELDKLFKRVYEDLVANRLSEERFRILSEDYETEQRQLKSDVVRMEADDVTELTPTVLNEFISRIEVHAPQKIDGKRHQAIDIYYNAVGIVSVPAEEDTAAMAAKRRAQQAQTKQSA